MLTPDQAVRCPRGDVVTQVFTYLDERLFPVIAPDRGELLQFPQKFFVAGGRRPKAYCKCAVALCYSVNTRHETVSSDIFRASLARLVLASLKFRGDVALKSGGSGGSAG